MFKPALFTVLTLLATGIHAAEIKGLRFGVEPAYAPFEYKQPDGSLAGFDIDIGNAICAQLHAKCVWVENSFDGIIPALKAKKFDAILSSMSVTDKRRQEIDFSDKVYSTATRLVIPKSSSLEPTVGASKGKNVGVQQGTVQELYANAHWRPHGVNVQTYQSQDQVYQDLANGRLDASLQNAVAADEGFLKLPAGKDFKFSGENLKDDKTLGIGTAIGLRKEDTALKQEINAALAHLIQDGAYQTIEKKYFTFSIY